MSVLSLVILAAAGALALAAFNYCTVKKMDEGTDRMQEIAEAIRIGANAFVTYEYKLISVISIIVAVVLGILVCWQQGVCFLLGAVMSASAGWIGMKIATYANVRVSNKARTTKKLGETLKVAFQGGSVMGLSVGGFALLGLFLVFMIFGKGMGFSTMEAITTAKENWLGIPYIPFPMCLSGYALGCSLIAMFNRVGGGIYTKAADMGADLVGKMEAHIPEDDPRNPATIADNVGDNVGDVAGLGSDLLESYVGAITAAIILVMYLFVHQEGISEKMMDQLLLFPLLFAAGGIFSCIVGVCSLVFRKVSDEPYKELNGSTWLSAGLTIAFGFFATFWTFYGEDLTALGSFRFGMLSPWLAATIGVIAGILIGMVAEYYTSYEYKPTRKIADASKEGPALTITEGLSVGMKSCMIPLLLLGMAIGFSYFVCGMFGVSMAAIGMLSFVSMTVSVDTYGPISDNAGGIAEMSELEPGVRKITDKLDSVGNTTAAIGKGFAIGSAALAALSLMVSYLYSFHEIGSDLALNIIDPMTLAGALIGAALPYLFSGILIEAVADAAKQMVKEVRRQFKEIPGILKGTEKPDYKTCIEISSQGALREMRYPALLSIIFPLICGFLFGPYFVGGVLIGATISAIMLAIFTGNAGGAWDNGKKFIEAGGIPGEGKGSSAHDAAVVGDTVGDPLKDTVGPSLDILIKIMSTVSLVTVAVFNQYNVAQWILHLLNK